MRSPLPFSHPRHKMSEPGWVLQTPARLYTTHPSTERASHAGGTYQPSAQTNSPKPPARPLHTWAERHARASGVEADASPLSAIQSRRSPLQRARNPGLCPLEGGKRLHQLSRGRWALPLSPAHPRPHPKRRRLQARQRALGHSQGAVAQHLHQPPARLQGRDTLPCRMVGIGGNPCRAAVLQAGPRLARGRGPDRAPLRKAEKGGEV